MQVTGSNTSDSSSLVLNSMTFDNGLHVVAVTASSAEAGSAAVFSAGIPVEIMNSTFSGTIVRGVNNVAGGAVLVSMYSLVVKVSTLNKNEVIATASNSNASGGAIATLNGSGITVVQSVFSENSDSRGGAIAPVNEDGVTLIQESTFTGNNALGLGGAIWARSTVEIELSTFYRNNAVSVGSALFFQPLFPSSSGHQSKLLMAMR